MENKFDKIYRQIDFIRILMPLGDEDKIESAFSEMFDTVSEVTGNEYRTTEDICLMIDVFCIMAENFIRKDDTTSFFVRALEWEEIINDFLENEQFDQTDKQKVKERYLILHTTIHDYMALKAKGPEQIIEDANFNRNINVREHGCKCMLCKVNEANETGSHMVPNNLIEKLFSIDGEKGRERAVVERFILGKGKHETYLGRDIFEDLHESLINRRKREDETAAENRIHNPLTFDYFFCNNCEKKLAKIESLYSMILHGKKDYDPAIPYLFWMSVTWRMSISKMGIVLSSTHEEKYRKILDRSLSTEEGSILTDIRKLGHCAYTLHECNDTKNEALGILGCPAPTVPALYIIGNKVVRFYHSLDKARKIHKQFDQSFETINDGSHPEVISDCPFEGFWNAKRNILDMNWEMDYDDNPEGEFGTDVSQFIKLENFEKESLDETGEIRNYKKDFTNEGGYRLVFPRALLQILDFMKTNEGKGYTIEDITAKFGYTKEQIEFMFSRFLHDSEKYLNETD